MRGARSICYSCYMANPALVLGFFRIRSRVLALLIDTTSNTPNSWRDRRNMVATASDGILLRSSLEGSQRGHPDESRDFGSNVVEVVMWPVCDALDGQTLELRHLYISGDGVINDVALRICYDERDVL
ncbi:hypothetical protein ACJJTC_005372 [Scirpophaga incertulas]